MASAATEMASGLPLKLKTELSMDGPARAREVGQGSLHTMSRA